MDNSTLLVLGMMLGFEKGHEIYEGVEWNSDTAKALLKKDKITKEDVFSAAPNGKSVFEYRRAWQNIRALSVYFRATDQQPDVSDLKRIVKNGKTAIDMAKDCDAIDELFTPEIWVGNIREMENVWYSILKSKRLGKDFAKIKGAVARLEGRVIREEELERIGIKHADMRTAVGTGNIGDLLEKLKHCGKHLKLDDVLLCDDDGDHALYAKSAWANFEKIFTELRRHGEIPDADFFLYKRADKKSILDAAIGHGEQGKLFNSTMFAGRPDEIMKLYDAVAPADKGKIDIDSVLADIIENMHADKFRIDDKTSIQTLMDVLYRHDGASQDWQPIIGLALRKTWDEMDNVRKALQARGEHITLSHLRVKSGFGGETCLRRAVRFGHFDKVLDILEQSGESLCKEDFLDAPAGKNNLLSVIVDNDQIESLLKPELWVKRVGDLRQVWSEIPSAKKAPLKDVFNSVQTKANMMSLRTLQEGGTNDNGNAAVPAGKGPAPRL